MPRQAKRIVLSDELIQYYLAGNSIKNTSEKFHIGETAIRNNLIFMGIKTRNIKEVRKIKKWNCTGASNGRWLGGVNSTTYNRIRRDFKPDICEICGEIKERMATHHIDKDHTNNTPENLMVLCPSCHSKLHWKQGDIK